MPKCIYSQNYTRLQVHVFIRHYSTSLRVSIEPEL